MTKKKELSTDLNGPDLIIDKACRKLMESHKKISLRSVAAEVGVAHTTLSRNQEKREQVEQASRFQLLAEELNAKRRGALSYGGSLELANAKNKNC